MSSFRNVEMALEKAVTEYCLPSFSKLRLTVMSKKFRLFVCFLVFKLAL